MSLPLELDGVSNDPRDAERLRDQARSLEARAERLRAEYHATMADARALERDAVAIDERVAASEKRTRRRTVNADADDMGRVCDLLDGSPLATGELLEELRWAPTRLRAVLTRLEAIGMVTRTGVKRGTRYRLSDDLPEDAAPEHSNVRQFGNYSTVVRDKVIELDTFDFVTLQSALPEISEGTLRRWLSHFEARGVVSSVRDGRARVYAYAPVEGEQVARRRQETPEALAARDRSIQVPSRGVAVAGSGKQQQSGSSVVNELLRELRGFPQVQAVKRKHKFAFMIDGREVASCSTTPGASALGGTRKALRDAGVPVK